MSVKLGDIDKSSSPDMKSGSELNGAITDEPKGASSSESNGQVLSSSRILASENGEKSSNLRPGSIDIVGKCWNTSLVVKVASA